MAEVNGTSVNGSVPPVAEQPVNRVAEKAKAKAKPKPPTREERLNALWAKFSDKKFTLKGEVGGRSVSETTDGFPEDISPDGVIEHFRENGAKASRKVGVGAASGTGKAKAEDGDHAAELAAILIGVDAEDEG